MYEDQSYEEILGRMLDRISGGIDKREGSLVWDSNAPAAAELASLYISLRWMLDQAFADTASREYLIRHAKDRGIFPEPASGSILKAVCTPASLEVPIGARFSCETLNYRITEKIAPGEYKLLCETPGTVGNKNFGILIPIEFIPGLETATLKEVLIPGEDEESDESLRKRYYDSFRNLSFGGNRADYLSRVNAIPGVGAVKVERAWNHDMKPSDFIPNANVESWFSTAAQSLPPDAKKWVSALYEAAKKHWLTTGGTVKLTILASDYGKASSELIATVEKTLDPGPVGEGYGLAPIGHLVHVETAVEAPVEFTISFTFAPGYHYSALASQVQAAIEAYFLELRKGWEERPCIVRQAQIYSRLLSIEGIIDVTSVSINGKSENLSLKENEIPAFSGVKGG